MTKERKGATLLVTDWLLNAMSGTLVNKRNKVETKRRIANAAAEEFALRGYNGATLRSIAERAKCSKALIIRYFGSKRELYRAVLNSKYAELAKRETVHSFPKTSCVVEFLREIFSDLFAFNVENPQFSRLIAWENLHGAKHLDAAAARAAREPGFTELQNVIETAKEAGLIRKDLDIGKFVYALQAITVVYFTNRYTMSILTNIPFDSPKVIDEFIDFYAHLLAQGISTDKGQK